jgi:NAD-dependent dihydropyrimidine dehydrogenase PreA subunit
MKCIEACPVNVFSTFIDEHDREVVDPLQESECIICLLCELVCPTDAISVKRYGGSQETMDSLLRDASDY